ncbi:MAG: hypothetical protein E6Q88_13620 [Lysobacteraceae bacterium]|nr:MAG: hypothetical protein E6Q88_13620 [Xanthomonadaceae bacterium]
MSESGHEPDSRLEKRTGSAFFNNPPAVDALYNFGYAQIRYFGHRAISLFAIDTRIIRHIALTVHGPGYGLDEVEAFESELAGVIEAISQNDYPAELEKITFVERNADRARRLKQALSKLLPTGRLTINQERRMSGLAVPAQEALRSVGYNSDSKPKVFVAMPFAEHMNDLFHYGIQGAVNSAGFLAERADMASFTGDIMDWVRNKIASAELVIADLSGANPNVYLEVGYAWGKGIPTVLITNDVNGLKFDVRNQRSIIYASIKDLEEKLCSELKSLRASRR